MNQIDIPDYQHHLDCNAKRMVRVTFLEKSLYFIRKCRLIRLLFAYSIFKSIEFYRVKKLFKSNQIRYGEFHGHLESKTKRILAIACLGKKLVFHT